MCVQWHADDADVTMTAIFSFSFCYPFLFVFLPFVISTRMAKILIRGHLHYLRHPRAIKTSYCKEENIVFRPIKHRFLKPCATKIMQAESRTNLFDYAEAQLIFV